MPTDISPAGSARHVSASTTSTSPSTTSVSTSATLTKINRSSATYTTGASVSATPIASRIATAITDALPPTRNVSSVAELSAQPGHRFPKYTRTANTSPQCFHDRLKPVSAVSPVASV